MVINWAEIGEVVNWLKNPRRLIGPRVKEASARLGDEKIEFKITDGINTLKNKLMVNWVKDKGSISNATRRRHL